MVLEMSAAAKISVKITMTAAEGFPLLSDVSAANAVICGNKKAADETKAETIIDVIELQDICITTLLPESIITYTEIFVQQKTVNNVIKR